MSVLKALALAEGLAPFSTKLAYIYRPADGGKLEIAVALRKIMDRKIAGRGPGGGRYFLHSRQPRRTGHGQRDRQSRGVCGGNSFGRPDFGLQ